jgi:uncharacterized protein YndB with AHSA1/START domain
VTVTTRVIAAPPTAVDAVLADPDTYPSWLVGAKRMEEVDADFPAPGSGFDHEVGGGPVEVHDRTDVTGRVPGRDLQLVVRARPLLVADVSFHLEPVAEGTSVRMEERPRGAYRWFSWLIGPLVRVRNERSLQRLAALVERGGATP